MNTGVILIFGVIWIALAIWTAVDANSHPDWAWQRVGQNKMVWIIVPIIGAIICGFVTLGMAIAYFASIKPKLVAAESSGGGAPGW